MNANYVGGLASPIFIRYNLKFSLSWKLWSNEIVICILANNCCEMSISSQFTTSCILPLAHSYSSFVPHGAQLSFLNLFSVRVVQSYYISTLWWVSKCCKMSRSSQYKTCFLLSQQICAPSGLVVFYEARFGSRGSKSLYVDHSKGVQLLQNVSVISIYYLLHITSCIFLQQIRAPWGTVVISQAPLGSCGSKLLYVDPLMGVQMLHNVSIILI